MANQRSDSRVSMLGMHFTLLEMTLWQKWDIETKELYIANYGAMLAAIQKDLTADDRGSIQATIDHMAQQVSSERHMRDEYNKRNGN